MSTHENHRPRKRRLPEPTKELPGTEAKIAILEERARRQLTLWHPKDATEMGRRPSANTRRTDGHTGVARHSRGWIARVWCKRLKAQIYLGLYQEYERARAAAARARKLIS